MSIYSSILHNNQKMEGSYAKHVLFEECRNCDKYSGTHSSPGNISTLG